MGTAGIHLLALLLLIACLPHPVPAETGGAGWSEDGGTSASAGARRVEREKRLLLRTVDDLDGLLALAGKEVSGLEREIDAIKPLESPARETDLRDVIGWYSGYGDWLRERRAEHEDDLAQLSSGHRPADGGWSDRYDGMAAAFKAFESQLRAMAGRFDSEGKRLAKIIERRRDLQGTIVVLEDRLARIERRLADHPEKREHGEREMLLVRGEIGAVQNQLLALPLVDEDILRHYGNLAERTRGEGDWLQAKAGEYAVLADVSDLVSGDGPFGAATVESERARVRRVYEKEIERMRRRIDALDQKRSRVSPAGSLAGLDRSAELQDFYMDQKQRYEEYISRLKIRLGALEADLSEL